MQNKNENENSIWATVKIGRTKSTAEQLELEVVMQKLFVALGLAEKQERNSCKINTHNK